MNHIQVTIPGWLEPVKKLPDYSLVKAVDQGQVFREVKAINTKIYTCLRHMYDGRQNFGGTYEENKEKARIFFDTFVDGTFRKDIAQHCDFIEEWNEYLASGDSPQATEERVRWARAAAEVWLREYRIEPELSHIRLVLTNTAVGNWIHRDFAVVARDFDCAMGYHPYTGWGIFDAPPKVRWGEDHPLDQGVLDTQDWLYLSGLWDSMEHDWGIKLDWVFTEAGPFESALDGWRSSNCLGGDRSLYVKAVRDWIRDVQTTPAYAEGRTKGFGLFTTGRTDDKWKYFWTEFPELNDMADMLAVEWKPGQPVDPPDPGPDPDPPKPPLDHIAVVNLLPQNATKAEKYYTVDETDKAKETILQSADDAAWLVSSAKPGSKVVVWEPGRWQNDIDKWLKDHGVDLIEHATYPFEDYTIHEIVEDLPKHSTLTYRTRPLTDITTLTIHHTVTPDSTPIENIASFHVNERGWPGIGYHYVIKADGSIYQTNWLETKSYHAGTDAPGDENLYSVGIALQGDFTHNPPPQAQLDAAHWLVTDLKSRLDIDQVLGHKEMPGAQTACPGATSPNWLPYLSG